MQAALVADAADTLRRVEDGGPICNVTPAVAASQTLSRVMPSSISM
jgi:hypothetical protein